MHASVQRCCAQACAVHYSRPSYAAAAHITIHHQMQSIALETPCAARRRRVHHQASSSDAVCGMQVEGMDAEALKDRLAAEFGIMVRHYRKPLLDGFVRISVGKPEQTDALMTALQTISAGNGHHA
jgi:histidinol-phosphate/aromatic aminotransferase/cobyric acid decarboxylase-like protein